MTAKKLYQKFISLFPNMSDKTTEYKSAKDDKNSIVIKTVYGTSLRFTFNSNTNTWTLEKAR